MDWMQLLQGMMGSGEKPGQASQQATMGLMGGLSGLLQQLGGISGNQQTQQAQGGQQMNDAQKKAILSLFQPSTEYKTSQIDWTKMGRPDYE